MSAPVYGLVLAGGRSIRMGTDKAALVYRGLTQLDRAMGMIQPFVEKAFVSVRADQTSDLTRGKYEQIVDGRDGAGPVAGLLAAQSKYSQVAWLVLACDLPFLDAKTLKHLLTSRRTDRLATAYRSSHDGLPEPLCAIYEPASHAPLAAQVAAGKQCPRKFLMTSDVELIDQPDPRSLDNINTPAEHGAALDALAPDPPRVSRKLKVQYYALLREQAKRREETLDTQARDPAELYEELRARHPFTLPASALRVAVNADFVDWNRPLVPNDTVVFIPPVAGG